MLFLTLKLKINDLQDIIFNYIILLVIIMNNEIRKKIRKGEIIPLKYDFVFGTIFNNPKYIGILEIFLSMYLEYDIEDIKGNLKIMPRKLLIENKNDKQKEVDLILDYKGEKINIELNNTYSPGIKDRNIVYVCYIHGRQLKYGDNNYQEIERTIQINLNNSKGEEIEENYCLLNLKNGKLLTEKLKIDIINLQTEENKCYTEREKELYKWSRVLMASKKKELKDALKEIAMDLEDKKNLENEVDKLSQDEEIYALYSKYSRQERIDNTLILDAREQGLKEGLEQGLKEGLEKGLIQKESEFVKESFNNGVSIEMISKITKLPIEKINDILNF